MPDGMYLLFLKLQERGLVTDPRVAHYWLDKSFATGRMEPVKVILDNRDWGGLLAGEFAMLADCTANLGEKAVRVNGPSLSNLLMSVQENFKWTLSTWWL